MGWRQWYKEERGRLGLEKIHFWGLCSLSNKDAGWLQKIKSIEVNKALGLVLSFFFFFLIRTGKVRKGKKICIYFRYQKSANFIRIKRKSTGPGWCGLVDWVPAFEQKDCQFSSQSGTRLNCGPGPQPGVCERQPMGVSLAHWCFSPSHSPSPPSYLEINT